MCFYSKDFSTANGGIFFPTYIYIIFSNQMNLANNYAYKQDHFSAENVCHPIPSTELKRRFGINLFIVHILYDLNTCLHSKTIQLIQYKCLSFPCRHYKSVNTEHFFIEANGSMMTSPGPEFGPMSVLC